MPLLGNTTVFQVGTYNPLTDVFSLVLDLNDFATFWIEQKMMKMPQPKKTYVRSSNVRFPGENVLRYQYQNRHIQVSVRLKNTNTQQILNSIRALMAAIENPPYALRIALPAANAYSYADVVAVSHNIPTDPQALLALVIPSIQIDFECKPGLRGNRLYLQNLLPNPGFEAPNNTGVVAFIDTLANMNAYTTQAGSAPTLAANVMTIPNGTRISFGSPAWQEMWDWQIRFQFLASAVPDFYLHYTDANNFIDCFISAGGITLRQNIGGTGHTLASAAPTLTANNWYWLQLTQFPFTNGTTIEVQAILYNDNAGAIGSAVTNGSIAGNTFNYITAINGKPQIAVTGANLPIGGAFTNVHSMSLFGPGGWSCWQNGGTGVGAFAWEQTLANTYPNGPVTSFAAGRLDIAPAGTLNVYWTNYNGGVSPIGTTAMVLSINSVINVIGVSCVAKSVGVGAGCTVSLYLNEYNATGTYLRQTLIASMTGVQPWTTLSGTATTGASTAYGSVALQVVDATAGSANGTVWFDNVCVWNETVTGMQSMPYCELRFPMSPGQLMVSGVQGDMIAPCISEVTGFFAGFANGQTAALYLGRRAQTTPNMKLVQASTASTNGLLDAASYGGFHVAANVGPLFYSTQAETGTFHLLARAVTANAAPTGVFIAPQVFTYQVTGIGTPIGAVLGGWQGSNATPFVTQNVWTCFDAGQVILPVSSQNSLIDPTQVGGYVSTTSGGAGGSLLNVNYVALLPVDGELVTASLANNGPTILNQWIYLYIDGAVPGSTSYSLEGGPAPNPAHSIANQGPLVFSNVYATPNGNSAVQLDPTQITRNTAGDTLASGVNQFLLQINDNAALLVPIAVDFVYSPLYLYPR